MMFPKTLLVAVCVVALQNPESVADPPVILSPGPGQTLELVRIPHGTFLQGSDAGETGREDDERQHSVTLSRDFFISKTPVTVGHFRSFVSETGYRTEAEAGTSGGYGVAGGKLEQRKEFTWKNPGYAVTDLHPVTIVTFEDAQAFLKWLSGKSGRTLTLPTEAQWEYACRAGSSSPYYCGAGDAAADAIAWHEKNSNGVPAAVAQKQPNAVGLFDMSGNVYEWCLDAYNTYPADAVTDPLQELSKTGEPLRRVLRGGSWMRLPKKCRSAARYRATPGTRNAENGFRVVTFDAEAVVKAAAPANGSTSAVPAPPAPVTIPSAPVAADTAEHSGHGQSAAPPEQAGGGSFLRTLLILFFLAMGGWIVFRILSGLIGPSSTSSLYDTGRSAGLAGALVPQLMNSPADPRQESVRIEDDGFWVRTQMYGIGTRLVCAVISDGQQSDFDVVIEEPEEQFVYTGVRPDSVHISVAGHPRKDFNSTSTSYDDLTRTDSYPDPRPRDGGIFVYDPIDPPTSSHSGHTSSQTHRDSDHTSTPPAVGFPPAY